MSKTYQNALQLSFALGLSPMEVLSWSESLTMRVAEELTTNPPPLVKLNDTLIKLCALVSYALGAGNVFRELFAIKADEPHLDTVSAMEAIATAERLNARD